jgi:hypothetical protein
MATTGAIPHRANSIERLHAELLGRSMSEIVMHWGPPDRTFDYAGGGVSALYYNRLTYTRQERNICDIYLDAGPDDIVRHVRIDSNSTVQCQQAIVFGPRNN